MIRRKKAEKTPRRPAPPSPRPPVDPSWIGGWYDPPPRMQQDFEDGTGLLVSTSRVGRLQPPADLPPEMLEPGEKRVIFCEMEIIASVCARGKGWTREQVMNEVLGMLEGGREVVWDVAAATLAGLDATLEGAPLAPRGPGQGGSWQRLHVLTAAWLIIPRTEASQ